MSVIFFKHRCYPLTTTWRLSEWRRCKTITGHDFGPPVQSQPLLTPPFSRERKKLEVDTAGSPFSQFVIELLKESSSDRFAFDCWLPSSLELCTQGHDVACFVFSFLNNANPFIMPSVSHALSVHIQKKKRNLLGFFSPIHYVNTACLSWLGTILTCYIPLKYDSGSLRRV